MVAVRFKRGVYKNGMEGDIYFPLPFMTREVAKIEINNLSAAVCMVQSSQATVANVICSLAPCYLLKCAALSVGHLPDKRVAFLCHLLV